MFQFPTFALRNLLYSVTGDAALPAPGCPIRIPPGLRSFAPTRSFSQLTASFIAYSCLGIRHMPFVACPKILTALIARLSAQLCYSKT